MIIKKLCSLLFTLAMLGCNETKNAAKTTHENVVVPNIVYILADDMGYGDISSLNPKSGIRTPNMDAIVRKGIHFTDAHSSSSVCTPTRYGILTGRYAWKTRLKVGVLKGYSPPLIEKSRTTVASFLKAYGYHTACIGKWHLGLGWQPNNPVPRAEQIERNHKFAEGEHHNVDYTKPVFGPNELGFDYSYIIPASLDMPPYVYLKNGLTVAPPTAYTNGKGQKKHGRGVFWRAGEMSANFDFEDVLPHFTEKAVTYIEKQSKQKKPFFLYFPLTAPHTPWLPDKEVSGETHAGKYGDFVKMVDNTVGEVVNALKKSGQLENTLVIVTSDNGSNWTLRDKEEYVHRANYIYRGQKADIYEGGHRIPFIAQWPKKIESGSRSNQTICLTDLMATVAAIIKEPLPNESAEDSFNLWPAFTGEDSVPIRDYTIHHSLKGYFAIRKDEWKLTPHLGSGGFTHPQKNDPAEEGFEGTLYNLKEDPGETTNLYNEEIEIREDLLALLKIAKR